MAAISLIELIVKIVVLIAGFWLVGQLLIRTITASARRAGALKVSFTFSKKV
jgi:hypothetical protein